MLCPSLLIIELFAGSAKYSVAYIVTFSVLTYFCLLDESDDIDEDEALAFSGDEFNFATLSDYEDDDKEDFDVVIPHQESEPESGDDMDQEGKLCLCCTKERRCET